MSFSPCSGRTSNISDTAVADCRVELPNNSRLCLYCAALSCGVSLPPPLGDPRFACPPFTNTPSQLPESSTAVCRTTRLFRALQRHHQHTRSALSLSLSPLSFAARRFHYPSLGNAIDFSPLGVARLFFPSSLPSFLPRLSTLFPCVFHRLPIYILYT